MAKKMLSARVKNRTDILIKKMAKMDEDSQSIIIEKAVDLLAKKKGLDIKDQRMKKYGILPSGKKNLKPKFVKPKNKRR